MKKALCMALVGSLVCPVSASAQTLVTYALVEDADCAYHIEVITDGTGEGLALWGADVVWVTGTVGAQMANPGGVMAYFENDATNHYGLNNPAGYGGTTSGNSLLQVGGGQNTIDNDAGYAPYPLGDVQLGVGDGLITVATGQGADGDVIKLDHCFANVLDDTGPDVFVVSAATVAGCGVEVELSCGAVDPPVIVYIESIGEHGDDNGAYGSDVGYLGIPVAVSSMTVEPRLVDATAIQGDLENVYVDVEFDKAIQSVVLTGDPGGDAVTTIATNHVEIRFTTLPTDKSCYTFDLAGTTDTDGGVLGAGSEFCICYIQADIDQSGRTDGGDSNTIIGFGAWFVAADSVAANGPMVDCNRSGKAEGGDSNTVIGFGTWDPTGTPLTSGDCP